MFLTNTIYPANALFNAHGIPRKVIVDKYSAKLEVNTLAAYFRRQ
jgi:hypothetical protein